MKFFFTRAGLMVALAASLSAVAFAQTSAPQTGTPNDAPHGRFGKMGRRGGMGKHDGEGRPMPGRLLERLNLTDAQRTQLREIESRYSQNSKAQRDELRGIHELRRQGSTLTPEQQARAEQLRNELHESAARMHGEILAQLTTEQRDQLKQMREEFGARRERRREGREERRRERPDRPANNTNN